MSGSAQTLESAAVQAFQTTLRALRQREGWTHADLAERLGVSTSRAHFIETGKNGPRLSTAARVASVFNLTLPAFLSFNGSIDKSRDTL